MGRYRLSRDAHTDLLEIWTYIAADDVRAADKIIDDITEKLDRLAQFPMMGRAREELAVGIRSFVSNKYVILYRLDGPDIEIHRVIHGARDIPRLFD